MFLFEKNIELKIMGGGLEEVSGKKQNENKGDICNTLDNKNKLKNNFKRIIETHALQSFCEIT